MTLHSLPLFVRLQGRPVILLGDGEAAAAKRRLLARAGATIVGEEADAAIAIVAIDDDAQAIAAVDRLKARGILVNAVDRLALCDFTTPAIVDRDPVLIAIGTGGASAGLAATLRQRLEAILPASIGALADALLENRDAICARWPNIADRRRVLAEVLAAGGPLDLLAGNADVGAWLAGDVDSPAGDLVHIRLGSADPDDLTLRQARLLAQADRVYHRADVPQAILDRARADAVRIASDRAPDALPPGLSIDLEMAG